MIQLWLVPFNSILKPITVIEKEIASNLSPLKAKEFIFSRGQIRDVLSKFFNCAPLELPLNAPPGMPPKLGNNLGNISISHCKDMLFIGWSQHTLGIDIERKDRKIDAINNSDVFFCDEEKKELEYLKGDQLRYSVLKFWVLKEASIKWQKGSIGIDIKNWIIQNNFKNAYNKKLRLKISTNYFEYKNWLLGVAYNEDLININLNSL